MADSFLQFKILYSKDIGKKRKIFHEGILNVKQNQSNFFTLLNCDGKELRRVNESFKQISVGDEINISPFIVQIEELLSDSVSDSAPEIKKESPTNSQQKTISVHKFPKRIHPLNSDVAIQDFPNNCPLLNKPFKKPQILNKENVYEENLQYLKTSKEELSLENLTLDPVLLKSMKEHQITGARFIIDCFKNTIENNEIKGAILADEMGLGKTLTTISVIWAIVRAHLFKVIIVCPTSLLENWKAEINKWLGVKLTPLVIKSGEDAKSQLNTFSISQVSRYPVLIISYEMFRKYSDTINLNSNFNFLICDEGHRLKNIDGTKTINSLKSCRAKFRLVLTGTPIQNDLEELYALISFVSPHLLGSLSNFKGLVSKEKQSGEGEYENDPSCLSSTLSKIIIRRTQSEILKEILPPRKDYIIYLLPQIEQAVFYDQTVNQLKRKFDFDTEHLDVYDNDEAEESTGGGNLCLLPDILKLRKICVNLHMPGTKSNYSPKFSFIQSFVENLHKRFPRDKIVIVSSFISVLDDIQDLFSHMGWAPVYRIDGTIPIELRHASVERFNNENSITPFIFLLSTKAGGVGINLIGANRLIMLDLDWNPANDFQAMNRIWRQGQKKEVHIYRIILGGTIEETILNKQTKKLSLTQIFEPELETIETKKESVQNFEFKGECIQDLLYPLKMTTQEILNNFKKENPIEIDHNTIDPILNLILFDLTLSKSKRFMVKAVEVL